MSEGRREQFENPEQGENINQEEGTILEPLLQETKHITEAQPIVAKKERILQELEVIKQEKGEEALYPKKLSRSNAALYERIKTYNRKHSENRIELPRDPRPGKLGRGVEIYKNKEDTLEALAEREKLGLKNDHMSLWKRSAKGGNFRLAQFIYNWNKEHPENLISLPENLNRRGRGRKKYTMKERILRDLETVKQENGEEGLYLKNLGNSSALYARIKYYNKKHPEDRIELPKDSNKGPSKKYQSKEEALQILEEREKLGLENTAKALWQTKIEGGNFTFLKFIQEWNRENPNDRIELARLPIPQREKKYKSKEDVLQVLGERNRLGLENTPTTLNTDNSALLKFIYRWNKENPDDRIVLPKKETGPLAKYQNKEDALQALADREKLGLENTAKALWKKQGSDKTLLKFIQIWNRENPEDKIELPKSQYQGEIRERKYKNREDALRALAEREQLGLENYSITLQKTNEEGGDITLLIFIYRWNKEHPEDRINLPKSPYPVDRAGVTRLDPLVVWREQTQKFEATDEKRVQLWEALKKGNREAGRELAESFIPIVNELAQKLSYGAKYPHFEADLIQNGNLIVLEVLNSQEEKDRWNPNGGESLTDFIKKYLEKNMKSSTWKQQAPYRERKSINERYEGGELKYEPVAKDPVSQKFASTNRGKVIRRRKEEHS